MSPSASPHTEQVPSRYVLGGGPSPRGLLSVCSHGVCHVWLQFIHSRTFLPCAIGFSTLALSQLQLCYHWSTSSPPLFPVTPVGRSCLCSSPLSCIQCSTGAKQGDGELAGGLSWAGNHGTQVLPVLQRGWGGFMG